MATTNADHPLKGILNTNDDPNACAVCALPLMENTMLAFCCGGEVCKPCGEEVNRNRCDLCYSSPWKLTVHLRKKARKGHAWAQVQLGSFYLEGDRVSKSMVEALHWLEAASNQGHPVANYYLAMIALAGINGEAVDLARAHRLLVEAMDSPLMMTVRRGFLKKCQNALVDLASKYMYIDLETEGGPRRAKSILLPLVEEGMKGNAQSLLGEAFLKEDDNLTALKFFSLAANDPDVDSQPTCPAYGALRCCDELKLFAQAKIWARATKESLNDPELDTKVRLAHVQLLVDLQRRLRKMRDTCGGCGVEFEGKGRKFCRGCRAYCYCSRECQKMHWNRKKDGHREDCLGAMELKQKMKETKTKKNDARDTKNI